MGEAPEVRFVEGARVSGLLGSQLHVSEQPDLRAQQLLSAQRQIATFLSIPLRFVWLKVNTALGGVSVFLFCFLVLVRSVLQEMLVSHESFGVPLPHPHLHSPLLPGF